MENAQCAPTDGFFGKAYALNKTNTVSDTPETEDAENAKPDTMSTLIVFADLTNQDASIKMDNVLIVNYLSKCIQLPRNAESTDALKQTKTAVSNANIHSNQSKNQENAKSLTVQMRKTEHVLDAHPATMSKKDYTAPKTDQNVLSITSMETANFVLKDT